MTLRTIFSHKGVAPRYGFEEIPHDIAKHEGLAHFSSTNSAENSVAAMSRKIRKSQI